jgi:hypothetical protein
LTPLHSLAATTYGGYRVEKTVVAISNNIHNKEGLCAYLLVEQVDVCDNKLDVSLFNNADQEFDLGNFYLVEGGAVVAGGESELGCSGRVVYE